MSTTLPLNPYESPQAPVNTGRRGGALLEDSTVIRFCGSLTVDDMLEAERLAKTLSKKVEHWFAWAFALLTVLCLLGVAAYDLLYDDEFDVAPPALFVASVVGIGMALAIHRPQLVRSRATRASSEARGPYAYTSGEVSNEAIISATQDATSVLKWSAFCGYRSSDGVAILYQTYPRRVVIFARTKFEHDDAWTLFLDLVSRKLPRM
jgi:hypothetical protein